MSQVLSNAFLSIGGTTVSTKVRSINPNYSREMQDDSTMGTTARTSKAGLRVLTLDVEFNWDSDLDLLLYNALEGDAAVAIIFRPDAGAVAAGNPQYSFDAVLESFPPLGQSVGDLHTVAVTFQNADRDGLSRATS